MGQADIDRAARAAQRSRRLGPDPRCPCGWADPRALHREGDAIECYECAYARRGRPTTEEHHTVGRENDPTTVPVPGNAHRVLSELQREWPAAVRSNAERDPLLWLAGAALSLRDHLQVWVGWLAAVALWLVAVADKLRERLGERWWEELGVGTPWGAMWT